MGSACARVRPPRSRGIASCALLCLSVAVVGSPALAQTLVLAPAGDSFINSAVPNNNDGASFSLFTGTNGQSGIMRGLVRFATPASLQSRVTVSGVQLTMTTQLFPNGNVGTASTETLRALTEDWIEGNGSGDSQGNYVVGQPCGSALGVTWNQRDCIAAIPWATAGGSVSGSVSASASVPAAGGATVTWFSPGMIGDVQSWIDTPSSNHGWRISSSTEGSAGQAQRFVSKEGGAGAPSLSITYACKAGLQFTGVGCTTCTTAARAACVDTQSGNSCIDLGAPSTGYQCSCTNPAYVTGTGGTSCVDRNECVPNGCSAGGDPAATCTDHAAPATGYDCTCSTGYSFNGATCVDTDGCQKNQCAATGDSSASCVDLPAPATGYSCNCDPGYSFNGTSCVDTNACTVNHCRDGGDLNAQCLDQPPPSASYACKCDDGFDFKGPTCISSGTPIPAVGSTGRALLAILLGLLSLAGWAAPGRSRRQ